ncbi:MAG: DUF2062 domain-containing protein [Deferribacteraceae bacterium]|jgi:uncharacterized protein (DUF2062 family)|nr:DUF2062 domain-containing protein [Deferribacteraceae bacterium]
MKLLDKIRERLKVMLSLDYAPSKMALSSAFGLIVGFSPYIGFQTYIALAISSLFRLPVYPLIIGVYITNPITIPFIYAFTLKVGMWLMGTELDFEFDFNEFNLRYLLEVGKVLIVPFLVGCHVVGLVFAIFTYPIVYYIMKRYKRRSAK